MDRPCNLWRLRHAVSELIKYKLFPMFITMTNRLDLFFSTKLENVFMKHYAPNHMLAPKKGSSQKGVQLKP